MNGRFGEQIGLPGNHFFNQQMQESGLEMTIEPMTMALIGAGMTGIKGGLNMFQQGHARGEAERAGRTANQERVKLGKKQVRRAWKELQRQREIAVESLEILERNTNKQIDLVEEENARDWAFRDQLRFDDYARDAAAYNKSVEDYHTNLNLNDISANIAYEEERNYMDDFHTKQAFGQQDDVLKLKGDKLTVKQALTDDIATRIGLRREQEGFIAQTAEQDKADIIKGLQTEGKLRATGMAGRSARKVLQAAAADIGSRQAMRADVLMNRNSLYENEMMKTANKRYFVKKAFGLKEEGYTLNETKRAASLGSMLKASATRQSKIAAGKYSADLQAQRQVLNTPTLRRMEPVPFEEFRPEFQQVPKGPSKQEFYDEHMPSLSDENKIYGDAGGRPNSFLQIAGLGLDMAGSFVQAGGLEAMGHKPNLKPIGGG